MRQVRVGRHPNNTTRVVLDATGVTSYSVYPLYNPYRLVIDCVRGNGRRTTAAACRRPARRRRRRDAARAGAAARPSRRELLPVVDASASPRASPTLSSVVAAATRLPLPHVAGASVRRAASRWRSRADAAIASGADRSPRQPRRRPPADRRRPGTSAGGFSMARQLGLGVSRIVIDPGHGGHDPGAKGKGVTEAELVLDVALRLEKLLQKEPGVEVILTRRTDDFIPLQERTAIANREGADLFLSIHANASSSAQARGIETYFLNFANNLSAAAVAARENAASAQAMGALPDIVKAIALNNKLDESRDFATLVQRAMVERLRASNKTLRGPRRQAGAVRRADRRGDAERARGDLVRDQPAGSAGC